MRVLAISPSARADRSYLAALAFVVTFGIVQISAVTYHYGGQFLAARRAARPPVAEAPPEPTAAPAAVSQATPGSTSAPASAAKAAPAAAPGSRSETLLAEAKALRERGDTTNALAKLQVATQSDATNPAVLAEMADTYESMQLFDRSNETWRKVHELGATVAGPLYQLADMKLKLGVAATAPTGGQTQAAAPPKPAEAEGIPDGSVFGFSEITTKETPDPDAEVNLALRIGVKKRQGVEIDHTKVKIQVFFYDTVDNDKVVLTDADVNYEWITPDHDWKSPNPEVLAVTYVRPKGRAVSSEAALSEAAAHINPNTRKPRAAKPGADGVDAGPRKYLGYIVRVYYNDQLQTVRADPTKLLNLFPPPFTAPAQ